MLWLVLVTYWLQIVACDYLRWHFTLDWVVRDPAGHGPRPMIGINGQWPLPTLWATEGDTIELTVVNLLNESSTVHFHGIHFRGANAMDGALMVTQCPIAPGGLYTYIFQVNQLGTYWYHSHFMTQYGDGLRGVFIVKPKETIPNLKFDEEGVMSLTDYYQCLLETCLQEVQDGDPIKEDPVAVLMNEMKEYEWKVEANKTYLVHLANTAVEAGRYLYIEDHDLTVVEVDGNWVEPRMVKFIHTLPGQRVSFLVHTRSEKTTNFMIGVYIDPQTINVPVNGTNQTHWMVYNSLAPTVKKIPTVQTFDDVFDDSMIAPLTQTPLLPQPNITIILEANSVLRLWANGSSHSTKVETIWQTFNNHTYLAPKVPTLHTALSAPHNLKLNPKIYGSCVIPYVLPFNSIVELRFKGLDDLTHPMHGHGHSFQIVEKNGVYYNLSNIPLRDTVGLEPKSTLTLRFKADNPEVWLFHCHLEYHMDMGLGLTFIEAPDQLRVYNTWEDERNCKQLGIPLVGNVAGFTSDWTNDRGYCKELWEQ